MEKKLSEFKAKHSESLSVLSLGNNAWSSIMNFQSNNRKETMRSLLLLITDEANIIAENLKKGKYRAHTSVVTNISSAVMVAERILINLDRYYIYSDKEHEYIFIENKNESYNNGRLPRSLIQAIVSDVPLLINNLIEISSSVSQLAPNKLQAVSKASKLISPYAIIFNFISAFFTTLSNRMEQIKLVDADFDSNNEIDAKDFSFSSYFFESLADAVTNWEFFTGVLMATVENTIPEELQVWKDPKQVEFLGTNESETIDPNQFFEDAYTIFGNGGDDKLVGGKHRDALFGGSGNDTLIGRGGSDELTGGIGFDTYYALERDIIHDEDGKGQIFFSDPESIATGDPVIGVAQYDRNTLIAEFERLGNTATGSNNLWYSKNKDPQGNPLMYALRQGQDLVVYLRGGSDNVTIKEFFKTATDNGKGGLTALNITLDDTKKEDNPTQRNVTGNANSFNTFYLNDPVYTVLTGGDLDDLVFGYNGSAQMRLGAGNDRVFGSMRADTIYGDAGNDMINGSAFVPANTTKSENDQRLDSDFIVGGAGHDLINGMAGDDTIYTGVEGEHLLTAGKNERGDWAIGHLGNDTIMGSTERDLLVGGEGRDFLYGGASDDVLIGDGFLRFGSKAFRLSGNMPSFDVDYTGNATFTPGSAIGTEYRLLPNDKLGDPTKTQLYSFDATHRDNDKWDFAINAETGDYTLTTAVALANNVHRVTIGGNNDYLDGGYGNDLLIGQTGDDILEGGAGDDILWGDDNRDLTADSGNDYLFGEDGNDTLHGGLGDDYLNGGSGINTLDGGNGFDTYYIDAETFNNAGVANHNIITDSDGLGKITIGAIELDKLNWQFDSALNRWKSQQDKGIFLKVIGNDLFILNEKNAVAATVKNFQSKQLGIVLEEQNKAPKQQAALSDWLLQENTHSLFKLPENLFLDDHTQDLTYAVGMKDGRLLPSWLSFDTQNHTLAATPDFDAAGEYDLTITATDEAGLSSTADWHIHVENSNRAPEVSGSLAPQSLEMGKNWQFKLPVSFTDPDRGETEQLTYHLERDDGQPLPAWLKYDPEHQTLSGTSDSAGQFNIHVVATDPHQETVHLPLQLNITEILPEPDKVLHGSWGKDVLVGGTGNDRLYGSFGRDTLAGGAGNDRLEGGMGNDTYLFNLGDGHDSIYDSFGKDTLKLGDGIDNNHLWFSRVGRNLVIRVLGQDDQVTVEGWYNKFIPRRIETIQTADNSYLNVQAVQVLVQSMAAFTPQAESPLSVPEQMQRYIQNNHLDGFWAK